MDKFFGKAQYIKAGRKFDRENSIKEAAPLFRKKFNLGAFGNAKIYVQGLGIAHFYLNGKRVTEDLFISPVSDYDKILWVNEYDVTSLLKEGENVCAVICGNGFFNEGFETQFDYHKAEWRDNPKFILRLETDGETALISDDTWLCNPDSFITYNQIRGGETFDAGKYDPAWKEADFNDGAWECAVYDSRPPKGEFRQFYAQPVRECEYYKPVAIYKNARGYVADFGQNMSGYVRIKYGGESREIVIRHTEEIDENYNIKINNLDFLYPQIEFQTDRIITGGKSGEYAPLFTYHGFRYAEVAGLKGELKKEDITAVFVHEDIARRADFMCGNWLVNDIYRASIFSFYSNAFYTVTDCPTREKLGWTNDLQVSCEQLYINFDIDRLYDTFMENMAVEIGEDGSFPGVIPTCGWGRHNGPMADGCFFEIPRVLYLYRGRKDMLVKYRPIFLRYLEYLKDRIKNRVGTLGDWLGNRNNLNVPFDFLERFYLIKLTYIAALGERLAGDRQVEARLSAEAESLKAQFLADYMKDGECTVEEQSTVAALIGEGFTEDITGLSAQLIRVCERDGWKLTCGMFGLQYILFAFTKAGRADLALKLLGGEPGYATWFKHGATTLWELYDGLNTHSHNHHMFSCVVGWFFKGLLGITPVEDAPAFEKIELKPQFLREVGFAKGYEDTVRGRISAEWKIEGDTAVYSVTLPKGIAAEFGGMQLKPGKNVFTVNIPAHGGFEGATKDIRERASAAASLY